ncbi:MAG TPA: hypothetical protein VGH54_09795 [Mycobacterium sp.]|jgi:hypothetical protein|uniref:hypothetical protein n=1 Tax=Mycobacterium sp. TaxID=1785 RepID=UPI002F414EDA
MGHHEPRTAADEIAEAKAKLDAAFAEMETWRTHLDIMAKNPQDREAVAFQARRSAGIVAALIAEAESGTRVAERLQAQLTVVS